MAMAMREPKVKKMRPTQVATFPVRRVRRAKPLGSTRGVGGGGGPSSMPGNGGIGPPQDVHWFCQEV